MNKEVSKLRIEINNLKEENINLKNKIKELEKAHQETTTSLVDTFKIVMDEQGCEIGLLKEGKAKIEAELILKELMKMTQKSQGAKE